MRIGVIGVGGLGGYYGGLLAKAGHSVGFVARGAHLAALKASGLRVFSVHGDFAVAPVTASDRPEQIGPVDLVLICVKTPALELAAADALPLLGPESVVLGLQNGIDAAERIGAVVGAGRVLGAATWIAANIEAPGVIRQVSSFRRIVAGELDGRMTDRLERVVAALKSMGIAVEASGDIRKVLWTKFVFISGFSAVGTVTGQPVGDFRAVPETRAMLVALLREVEAVGRGLGVALDPDVVDQALTIMDGAEPGMRTSMQRDVVAGRPSEIEALVGAVRRKGREAGVPTPTADLIYAALLPGQLKALKAAGHAR
jgi:2-dehydropantoate 2-reductase